MKAFFSIVFIFLSSILWAQNPKEEVVVKTLEVGQKLRINACKSGQTEFASMDVYARTKAYNEKKVNKKTGEGLIEEFFKDKSIDAKRLPCVMGNKQYTIAAYHEFEVKGETKRVVLCYTAYPLTLIWIELDKAIELGEISFD
ncbi:MAG: hypothetical protein MH472_14190 [Bacteroidia bacterium]|nr:hypothetical protein [Bacteroidia bacterium]